MYRGSLPPTYWKEGRYVFSAILNEITVGIYQTNQTSHLRHGATVWMILRSEIWDGKTIEAWSVNSSVAHAAQGQLANLPSIWTFWHIRNDGIGKTWHHHVIWNRRQIGLSGLSSRLNHANNKYTALWSTLRGNVKNIMFISHLPAFWGAQAQVMGRRIKRTPTAAIS